MRKQMQNPDNCAVVRTMGYIGGKWKPIVLIRILTGVKVRFGKLAVQMPDISRKMSQQLKELEEDGLIIRHSYMEKPPRVEYELSEFGKTLVPVLKQYMTGAHRWKIRPQGVFGSRLLYSRDRLSAQTNVGKYDGR